MKCNICSAKIEQTFLEKINGAYMKVKGKQKVICPVCQKQYSKEELLAKL